jgi:flagellar FliL protein
VVDDTDAPEEDGEEQGEQEEGGGDKKKKLIMIGGGVLALLLVGGGALAFFMGWFGGGSQDGEDVAVEKPAVYFDMPEMVVNLSSGHGRAEYLKLKIAIEADSQDNIDALQPKLPQIQDMFLIYLREMRRSDLEGSAAVYRLKMELMRRINIAIHPASIRRVLFKEIVVQ